MTVHATTHVEQDVGEYGVIAAPGTVRFERVFQGSAQRLWTYFTESDKIAQWLAAPAAFSVRAGDTLELTWNQSQLSPQREPTPERFQKYQGYTTRWRVQRVEPPRLLSWLWEVGTENESEVTVELMPQDDHVRLVLIHTRLKDSMEVASGWHAHLAILGDVVAGRVARPFWSTYAAVEAEYQRRARSASAAR